MSLKNLSLSAIVTQLPATLTNEVLESLDRQTIERLKDLLFFKVFALYVVKHQQSSGQIMEEDYLFIGAYSTQVKARERYNTYMQTIPKVGVNKNIPYHRIVLIEYLLDATKGKNLYRAEFCYTGSYKFGPLPITNDMSHVHGRWAFNGTTRIGPENHVTLDEDVDSKIL